MFFIHHAHTLCLVHGAVHDFSPRERVIGHFVLTVNKPKLYQSQPKGPKTFRCSLRSPFKVGPVFVSNF